MILPAPLEVGVGPQVSVPSILLLVSPESGGQADMMSLGLGESQSSVLEKQQRVSRSQLGQCSCPQTSEGSS